MKTEDTVRIACTTFVSWTWVIWSLKFLSVPINMIIDLLLAGWVVIPLTAWAMHSLSTREARKRKRNAADRKRKQAEANRKYTSATEACFTFTDKLKQSYFRDGQFGKYIPPVLSEADYKRFQELCGTAELRLLVGVADNRVKLQDTTGVSKFTWDQLLAFLSARGVHVEDCLEYKLLRLYESYLDLKAIIAFISETGSNRRIGALNRYARVNRKVSYCAGMLSLLRERYLDMPVIISDTVSRTALNVHDAAVETLRNEYGDRTSPLPKVEKPDLVERQFRQLLTLTRTLFYTNNYLRTNESPRTAKELDEQVERFNRNAGLCNDPAS
jgi:hypothetical protein